MSDVTLDDILVHYGVKGMKWGVRRSEAQLAKASGGNIRRAREEHVDRAARIQRHVNIASGTYDAATQKRARDAIKKIANEPNAKETAVLASKLTKGERMVTYLAIGPVAPIYNSRVQKRGKEYAEAFIDAAKEAKIRDIATD